MSNPDAAAQVPDATPGSVSVRFRYGRQAWLQFVIQLCEVDPAWNAGWEQFRRSMRSWIWLGIGTSVGAALLGALAATLEPEEAPTMWLVAGGSAGAAFVSFLVPWSNRHRNQSKWIGNQLTGDPRYRRWGSDEDVEVVVDAVGVHWRDPQYTSTIRWSLIERVVRLPGFVAICGTRGLTVPVPIDAVGGPPEADAFERAARRLMAEAAGGDEATIRRYLAGFDRPCPKCQYNLRDNTSGHCPECGLVLMRDTLPQAFMPGGR